MKIKKHTLYGKHDYTTVEATFPAAGKATKADKILWDSENEIARYHGELRRAIRDAIRNLQEADARLEANLANGIEVAKLLEGINTLGILQGRAADVDGNVRALAAALRAHLVILAALNADEE